MNNTRDKDIKNVGLKPNLQANDTYVFNINDGNDFIMDFGGDDTIQFGEGITTENINFLKDFENSSYERNLKKVA